LTSRRKKLREAQDAVALRVKARILPVMRSQYKRLERFLRRANLRKRLTRIKYPDEPENIRDVAFYKVQELFKAPSPPKSGTSEWDNFKKALLIALLLGLFGSVDDLGAVENEIWQSRGFDPLTFDPEQIIQDYQLRTGRNLAEMGDYTLTQVQAIISDWYMTDEPFTDLLDDLDRLFNESRAESIAVTEVGNVTSQIFLQEMISHGWTSWYWNALGEDPCTKPLTVNGQTYDGCLDLHGRKFKRGDDMPPDAAHPACRCQPTPELE
jgi:hypothetical protein